MAAPRKTRLKDNSRRWLQFVLPSLFLLLLLLFLFFVPYAPFGTARPEIAYTQFKTLLAQDKVAEVRLRGAEISAHLRAPQPVGPRGEPAEYALTRIPPFGNRELLPLLESHHVELLVEPEARGGWSTLLYLLPWLFLIGLIWISYRRASRLIGGGGIGPGSELQKFLEGVTKKVERPDVTFAEVAGQENAKREVQELVDYLREPERFRKLGAEVPRGVLLMGPPGTGKTLLARALAGEAGVPFFSISGSEFIEVFVGVGASRVRNLFAQAKKNAPPIIFVVEIDAVGRTRGGGVGGGNDEREQTLNQILVEMDGFEQHEKVIVLAASNRPDVLDPALVRPGRFDRRVVVDLPDPGG